MALCTIGTGRKQSLVTRSLSPKTALKERRCSVESSVLVAAAFNIFPHQQLDFLLVSEQSLVYSFRTPATRRNSSQ